MKKATFVHCARHIYTLINEDSKEYEKKYVIEKTITLSKIDYENFIHDFKVKHMFIEENKPKCVKTQIIP